LKKRICAQCTASSQKLNFQETRKSVCSAHKWTEEVTKNDATMAALTASRPPSRKQQPTDSLKTFLGLGDASTLSHYRAPSGGGRLLRARRCFLLGRRFCWDGLLSCLSHNLRLRRNPLLGVGASFQGDLSWCLFCSSLRRRLLQKYIFLRWHWCPRNGGCIPMTGE
jgi:hypothetical protein